MILQTIAVGPLDVNCYIIADDITRKGILIDPGGDAEKIKKALQTEKITLSNIIITHGHWDHVGAVIDIKKAYDCPICLHKDDLEVYAHAQDIALIFGFEIESPPEIDSFIDDSDVLYAGKIALKALHTPGHTRGSISLSTDGIVFTGDLIFKGGVGRTDFPGGDEEMLKKSIKSRIFTMPDDTLIYPGHGFPTTVIEERNTNPFLCDY